MGLNLAAPYYYTTLKTEYLIQQPSSLESLAVVKLADWIAAQADKITSPIATLFQQNRKKAIDLLSGHIETMRKRLEYVPWMSHNALAVETMRALKNRIEAVRTGSNGLKPAVISRVIEVLLTKKLTSLLINSDSNQELFLAVSNKSNMLSGLVSLYLGEIPSTERQFFDEDDAIELLKELRNLKFLFLYRNYFTISILACIAENCKSLEVLQSEQLPDNVMCYLGGESVKILCGLPNLRRVDLYNTANEAVTDTALAALLKSCKNLERVNFDRLSFHTKTLHRAIINLASLKENAQFNIKFYKHTSETSEEIQKLLRICPEIENIRTSIALTPFTQSLQLQNLRELSLSHLRFYSDHVKEFLETKGRNLAYLHLEKCREMDLYAMVCIAQCAVETLYLIQCEFKETDNNLAKSVESNTPLFSKLKRITVEESYVELKEMEVIFLLSNCPNVEFIHTLSVSLPNEVAEKFLDKNPLTRLTSLIMSYCKTHLPKYHPDTEWIEKITSRTSSLEVIVDYYTSWY